MPYRRALWAVALLGLLVGVTATIQGPAGITDPPAGSDLLSFFFPAAARVLDGHPFGIYAVRAFGDYPNYNPPVSIEAMAALIGVARAVDLPGAASCVSSGFATLDCRTLVSFVGLGFLPSVFVLGALVLAAIRRVAPRVTPVAALLAFGLIVLGPLLWLDFTTWGHLEQPLMLCFLVAGVLALQSGRTVVAAVLLALAVLTRTTALIPVLALFAVLAAERRWTRALTLAGVTALVAIAVLAPFFLADPSNATFSLLTWRSSAPIGNSIWSLVAGTSLGTVARSLDQPVAILLALAVGVVAVRRLGVTSGGRGLWGVLAIAAMLVPLVSKTNWPYYYAEPFVLLLIWEIATTSDEDAPTPAAAPWWRGPLPLLSLLFLGVAVTLGQFMGLHSVTNGGIVLRLMGITQFVAVGVFATATWWLLAASTREPGAPAPV
jgi:hypothetical protein